MNKLFIIIATLILTLALVGCGETGTALTDAQATATDTTQQTVSYQLATLDVPGTIPSTATLATYQKVLDSLHDKTGDDEITIGDDTVKGITELNGKGISDTTLQLMQNVDAIITKDEHLSYAGALAPIIKVLEGGK